MASMIVELGECRWLVEHHSRRACAVQDASRLRAALAEGENMVRICR